MMLAHNYYTHYFFRQINFRKPNGNVKPNISQNNSVDVVALVFFLLDCSFMLNFIYFLKELEGGFVRG